MSDHAPQTQDKFVLRLPDGMRDKIKAAAEKSGRSMNAEIVAALGKAYPDFPDHHSLLDYLEGETPRLAREIAAHNASD